MEKILKELTALIIGRLGYYSIAGMKKYLTGLAEWLRRRIRQMYWKRWKRVRARFESLIQFGIPRDQAWQWANTRKSYWHTANSRILTRTVTSRYLKSMGFPEILERFEMLHERIGRLLKLRTPIPTH
ncbi:MAG: hypothetical protein LBO80_00560 [Treponema sp.]|jgi:hypothetical protein|nr:hypothetical protein [Treponema sp.]